MAAALLLLVVAASLFWCFGQGASTPAPSPERPLVRERAPEPTIGPTDAGGNEPNEPVRTPVVVVRGTLRGQVVGPDVAPIAEATVSCSTGEPDAPQLVSATTRTDGRFWLAAPAGPLTLRIEAAGYSAVQLGGLAPDLDLGTLRLTAAVTYRGQVRAKGRGLADADVALRPVLGPPGMPTAVVQRMRTDEAGWFVFAQASPPPICLCVEAPGYWSVTRRLEEVTALQVDLDLVPRVRGRVVDAATRAAIADAHVRVDGTGSRMRVPAAERESGTRVQADGSFDLEVRALKFGVEANADGYLPTFQGPFVRNGVPTSLEMHMERGCSVVGTVTWRGNGIRVVAGLWEREDAAPHVYEHSFAEGEALRLPAVRPGRWFLRIDTDRTAPWSEWLELRSPGEHRLTIALEDGSTLVGSVLGPNDPGSVVMVERIPGEQEVFAAGHRVGSRRFGVVRGDGSFEVTGLGAGRWRAFVSVRGTELMAVAALHLSSLIGGETFDLAADEQQRRFDLPSISRGVGRLRGRCAASLAGAEARLLPTEAAQRSLPRELRTTTVGSDGAFVLDLLPPGIWHVEVRLPGAAPRVEKVTITAGAETTCVFQD